MQAEHDWKAELLKEACQLVVCATSEAAAVAAERIREFTHQAGQVVAKAELFDEKVGIGSKPSGTRIAMILTDYSEKLERVLVDMSVVVSQVTDLLRQLER
jgi:hypothetical protein